MRRITTAGLAIGLLLTVAAPGLADTEDPCRDEDGNLLLTHQQSWVKDPDGLKAGNLAAQDAAAFPTWDETAPTDSVQGGAGGGYFASSIGSTIVPLDQWDAAYTATFKGTFDGCLDTMAVTLYMLSSLEPAALGTHLLAARLYVDDVLLVDAEPTEVLAEAAGDVSYGLPFAFRGLVPALEAAGLDPSGTHDVTLQVQPGYSDIGHVVYVWDTTEVPSNIEFNRLNLARFTRLN